MPEKKPVKKTSTHTTTSTSSKPASKAASTPPKPATAGTKVPAKDLMDNDIHAEDVDNSPATHTDEPFKVFGYNHATGEYPIGNEDGYSNYAEADTYAQEHAGQGANGCNGYKIVQGDNVLYSVSY